MLADRLTTAVLYIVIAIQDPSLWGLPAFFIVLDLWSHWCQMYVTLSSGKTSHKGSENPWLNFYYTGPWVLFVACCGNEFFIMSWYLLGTDEFAYSYPVRVLALANFPIFLYKQVMNVVQLVHNTNKLVMFDVEETVQIKRPSRISQ
jgi:CDP-diacylglycerol--inositol 3-phosphatidyltransferase